MKKYFAPEAEVFTFRLEEDILHASAVGGEYGGDSATEDSERDPWS